MKWLRIKAHYSEEPKDWSAVHVVFENYGCNGTEQTDSPPTLSGYFYWDDKQKIDLLLEALSTALQEHGAIQITSEVVEDEDWSELWKQFFIPRKVGHRTVVVPTWCDIPDWVKKSDLIVRLNHGQAFGTGDHPTTRLCVFELENTVSSSDIVLDLGCGSGILSIVSSKLGAAAIYAVDIDLHAVDIAKQNFIQNQVVAQVVCSDSIPKCFPKMNVIVSNIVSATLIRLAPKVAEHLLIGGIWILSGVIEANWNDVYRAAIEAGFVLNSKKQEDDWICASFKKL